MNQRLKRISDQIQREIADLIRNEIKDPRLPTLITVSAVKVSADLGYADAYVTIMDPELEDKQSKDYYKESLKILNGASGFMRSELGRRMNTRTVPRIRFHYDEVTANGNHMLDLIEKANQSKSVDAKSDDHTPSDDADQAS